MSTRRPWKFRTAPTTAILDQPDRVRQEWHTSAFRLESRLSTSSSVQNIKNGQWDTCKMPKENQHQLSSH